MVKVRAFRTLENSIRRMGFNCVAGVDEVGRGCLAGPVVGFKYEAKDTVLAAAAALRQRVGAALVVANSLCGRVQALVDERGHERFPDRPALIEAVGARLGQLARR